MNVISLIEKEAEKTPHKKAVIFPRGEEFTSYSYLELLNNCNKLSFFFSALGIKKRAHVLFFVKPSLNFSVITFSLFKLGAVPIFIDPGMGLSNLLSCVSKTKPEFLVTERKGILLRTFFRKTFASIKKTICTKKFPAFFSIEKILATTTSPREISFPKLFSEDAASIIFTSGGTGAPKGVLYTHGMFLEQVELLRREFSYTENDRDLPGFPLFSMMTIAMGVTSVIPELDPTKPALCEPGKIVKNIQDHKVTTIAGSPAIWERVGLYCKENKITLPTVRALVMFGAPIPKRLHDLFHPILTNGSSYTPYGATECLPIASISAKELEETKLPESFPYKAICVGKVIFPTELKIVEETEKESESIENLKTLSSFEIGEILVKGKQVSPFYLGEKEATAKSKVKDGSYFWHKMGDLGFLDQEGRLWFCGRKAHKVRISNPQKDYYSIPTELVFNDHKAIKKTALIYLKEELCVTPALVIERFDGKTKLSRKEQEEFKNELFDRALSHENTKEIKCFFLHKKLPVDRRHNIKIDRQFLSSYFNRRKKQAL